MQRRMQSALAALLILALPMLSGCIYMNVGQPLDTDLHETHLGAKIGRSEAHSILGLVAWGDAGIQAAAKEGGISTLRHADMRTFSILSFVYASQETIVYGD